MKLATLASALLGLSAFFVAAPALAAADLAVSIPAPTAAFVYDDLAYDVVVTNHGNKSAAAVTLTITLPETQTSPNVHVMGILGAVDSRCAPSGTQLVCQLGSLGKSATTTVSFAIALPEAAETLAVAAEATTSSKEFNLADNVASDAPALLHYATALEDGDVLLNQHCTGQGLTSFYECTLYPSSISAHESVLHGDGTISFVDAPPGYTGVWSQSSDESLEFTYLYSGAVVAEFVGYGSSPGCFEGITSFPGSPYVAPYEVCVV